MNDKGVTTGEVQAHLAEIYGVQVSRDTISTITDRVLDSLAEWQSHPLDAVRAAGAGAACRRRASPAVTPGQAGREREESAQRGRTCSTRASGTSWR
jgi:hypothetical protein